MALDGQFQTAVTSLENAMIQKYRCRPEIQRSFRRSSSAYDHQLAQQRTPNGRVRDCEGSRARPSAQLTPIVETVLPLSEARKGHELNEKGHARGKIVLKVA